MNQVIFQKPRNEIHLIEDINHVIQQNQLLNYFCLNYILKEKVFYINVESLYLLTLKNKTHSFEKKFKKICGTFELQAMQ